MYVVRRAFRVNNQMVPPGSVVEPGSIKRFKTRLRDRYIVEVTEQNLAAWEEYFVGKFGVSIKDKFVTAKVIVPEGTQVTEEVVPKGTTAATDVIKPVEAVKPIVKPVVVAANK